MKWLVDNWSLLVVIACAGVVCFLYIKKFANLPSDEQIHKVKQWLLYAVTMAEKELGSGTGALKLRYVYSMFVDKFPELANIVSFETFSVWVDEVLEQMKQILATNKDIEAYVEGEEK